MKSQLIGKPLDRIVLVPLEVRFWAKVNKTDSCWLWTAHKRPGGYGVIRHNGRLVAAHRVSWEMAHGPIPEGLSVLHHCDVRCCVRPDHLFVGTQLDNMRDLALKGVRQPLKQKITNEQVVQMRAMARAGVDARELGRRFGVKKKTAWDIATGRRRVHVDSSPVAHVGYPGARKDMNQ